MDTGSSRTRAGEETVKRMALLAFCLCSQDLAWGGEITGKVNWRGGDDYSNVVVYAQKIPKEPVYPAKGAVVLDQINLSFVPHVLPVLIGTTVSFPNSDEVRHNVFSPSPAKRFNLGVYPRGVVRQVTFDQPGEVALLCNVHEEMAAYILVLETPYFAVTRQDGFYQLKGLAPGKYSVWAWHENFRPVERSVEITNREQNVRLDLALTSPK